MKLFIKLLTLGASISLCFLAIDLRTPLLASLRTELFFPIVFVSSGAIFWECSNSSKNSLLGRDFIVGYTNFEEVKTLVEKRAIGGVFITIKNVIDKTDKEIQTLQSIRSSRGLNPLWIATDL